MAIVKLESVEVTRTVGSNGAFAVAETITTNTGASFPKSWTVWAQGSQPPAVGSLVTVVGEFSAKTRTYPAPSGMKTAIDLNINNPEVTVIAKAVAKGDEFGAQADEGAPF